MNRGVIYVAYGAEAIKECLASIGTLRRSNPALPICVITDEPKAFRHAADTVTRFDSDPYGRIAKLSADKLSPFDLTLYLDADTRIYGDLSLPFCALEHGFEFVATLSVNQGSEKWLQHINEAERGQVLDEIGFYSAQVQGGVWAFRKTANTAAFFECWRRAYAGAEEWEQGALQLAFHRQPMSVYLLGQDYNGGNVIRHHYGQARRKDK